MVKKVLTTKTTFNKKYLSTNTTYRHLIRLIEVPFFVLILPIITQTFIEIKMHNIGLIKYGTRYHCGNFFNCHFLA